MGLMFTSANDGPEAGFARTAQNLLAGLQELFDGPTIKSISVHLFAQRGTALGRVAAFLLHVIEFS